MPMTCTACIHPSRSVIDRMLASGTGTLREIAGQYGLSTTALHRHKEHIIAAVRRTVEKRTQGRAERTTSAWEERLQGAYESAQRGVERAETDETQWTQGARFLAVMAKLIETGLEMDGVIGTRGITTTTTTVEQVLVLPSKPADTHSVSDGSIETYLLPEAES